MMGGLALGLDLGELDGVLGVLLFFELNGFRFLFHGFAFRWLLMVDDCWSVRLWVAEPYR